MKLSKNLPNGIDIFEALLPKLELMTTLKGHNGGITEPELRFINLIQELSIDSNRAKSFIQKIDKWYSKLDKEHSKMKKIADGYIEKYATDNNNYFKETLGYKKQAEKMLNFMSKIFEEFTYTAKPEKHKCYDQDWKRILHSVFQSSPLNTPNVQTSFIGTDDLRPLHHQFFVKLQSLFHKLEVLFLYALQVDALVENLRKDPPRIIAIFDKCNKKTKNKLAFLYPALNLNLMEQYFPELVNDLRSMNFDDFKVKYYHQLNVAEFYYLIPLYEMVLKENHNLDHDECSLYEDITDTKEKVGLVLKLRFIMNHLDCFETKGIKVKKGNDYHISAKFIAMVIKIVKIPSLKQKEFVETYLPKHYHGPYILVKYGAVNNAYNRISKEPDKYIEFENKMKRLYTEPKDIEEATEKSEIGSINYVPLDNTHIQRHLININ